MQLDIKKALYSPFSRKDWLPTLIVLSLLTFSTITSYYTKYNAVFMFFFMVICFGYSCQFSHNEINNIKPVLPSWKLDFAKYLKYGFFCSLGMALYTLILGIIVIPLGVLANIAESKIFDYSYIFVSNLVLIFIGFVQCLYSENFKFKDMLPLSKPFKLILNVKLELLMCFIVHIITGTIVSYWGNYNGQIYIKNTFFLFTRALGSLILVNLLAQTYKIAKERAVFYSVCHENK